MGWRQHHGGGATICVHPATLTFTPTKWDLEQPATLTVVVEGDLIGAAHSGPYHHWWWPCGCEQHHDTHRGGCPLQREVMAPAGWPHGVPPGGDCPGRVLERPKRCRIAAHRCGGSPSPAPPRWRNRKGCLPRSWALRPSPPKHWWRSPSFRVAPEPEGGAPRLASGAPSHLSVAPSPWMGR